MKFAKLDRIQAKAKKAILYALSKEGQALLQMATGTGKTNVARDVLNALLVLKPDARVLWLNHSNELIEQTSLRITDALPEMNVGVFNGEVKEYHGQVTIASIQTISRKNTLEKFDPNEFDFVFVDEVHHAPAATWNSTLEHFKNAKRFGFTATPYRPDGKLLDDKFGKPVFELSFRKAQRMGLLAKDVSYVILTNSVLKPMVTKNGEYAPSQLDRLHTSTDRNDTIVKSYLKYGRGAMRKAGLKFKTVCFCINAAHAKRMSEYFNTVGVKSDFIVGDSKHMVPTRRKAVYETFHNTFDIEVLCAVNIFNEGVDVPDISCVMMARPTRSNIIYSQSLGRGARAILGHKDKFVVLDFVDNTRREYQGYTMSNLTKRGVTHERVIVEYLREKDPVMVNLRVKNVMAGVEAFEDRVRNSSFTQEQCVQSASKYKTRREWSEAHKSQYQCAWRNGWLEECCKHMKFLNQKGKWNKATLVADAKKYKTRFAWSKINHSAYSTASRLGILTLCCKHMKNQHLHRTKKDCILSSRRCATKKEWSRKDKGAYQMALRNGWIKDCCKHMKLLTSKPHTKQFLMRSAKRFQVRYHWSEAHKSQYECARKNGWLEECCKHMKVRATPYTKAQCMRIAKKYNTRKDWSNDHRSMYSVASRRGWIKDCCKHMKLRGRWKRS